MHYILTNAQDSCLEDLRKAEKRAVRDGNRAEADVGKRKRNDKQNSHRVMSRIDYDVDMRPCEMP